MNGSNPTRNEIDVLRQQQHFTLGEQLVLDTALSAFERTFLAYLRTAFALVVTGLSFFHLFDSYSMTVMGIVCVPAGILLTAYSWIRYRQLKRGLCDRLQRYAKNSIESR